MQLNGHIFVDDATLKGPFGSLTIRKRIDITLLLEVM
jgi:hypothetical protein